MTLDERLKREVGRGYDVLEPTITDEINIDYDINLARKLVGRGYDFCDAVRMSAYSNLTGELPHNLDMAKSLAAYTLNEDSCDRNY